MTAGRTLSPGRFSGAVLILLAAACASEPNSGNEAWQNSVAARKRAMLMSTDLAIQKLLGRAENEITKVQSDFQGRIDAIATPVKLNIVHPVLEELGQQELAEFKERIKGHEATAAERLEEIVTRYEEAMWTVATEAGKREQGSDIGYRTGYADLDAKVLAAMAQLRRRAGLDGIQQVAAFRLSDRIVLIRKVRHEIEDVGIVSLLVSAPESNEDLVGLDGEPDGRNVHEGVAQATAFAVLKGNDPIPLRILQAVRYRVERGGIVIKETPWRWDPAASDRGEVPLYDFPGSDGTGVSTLPLYPRIDVTSQDFPALYDNTVVAEYRTGLQRVDNDEFLATLGWQIAWGVDYRGQTRVLVEDSMESVLDDDPVIAQLLARPLQQPEGPDRVWLEAADPTEGPGPQ